MISRINLPLNGQNENPEIEFEKLVILGANGAGKTRFGSEIEKVHRNLVHRISAQKSLTMPEYSRTVSKAIAQYEFIEGNWESSENLRKVLEKNPIKRRWNDKPITGLLNDYEKLMVLLHSEEAEESINFKNNGGEIPITKLDRVKKIWEKVLPHRELKISAGKIEAYPKGKNEKLYNASEMSDGERVIFYLAGSILAVPENSIIIIDEPEMHIHPSLIKSFFDLIEIERTDCSFIYLTHNIDFAFSRQDAKKIWIKNYNGDKWNYEILQDDNNIPEQIYYEILGSRKPVLFIEGDKSSLDYQIYQQVYPDRNIYPIDNCHKVIQTVKSFEENKSFHSIEANGIIDRDRRSIESINDLVKKGIWVLNVAEIENLFLLEEVIKGICSHQGKNELEIIPQVKNNIEKYFKQELNNQVVIHFKNELDNQLKELVNFKFSTTNDLNAVIDDLYNKIDKVKIFESIETNFNNLVNNHDYIGILAVFNQKGMIGNAKLHTLVGMSKPEDYKNLVIHLMKKGNENIKIAISNQIIKEEIS